MMPPLSFASGLPLAKPCTVTLKRHQIGICKCTLAPERNATEKKIRVLHLNSSSSTPLPPPPPRHYSIPFVGYFLEHVLNMAPMARDKKPKYGPIFASNYFMGEMVHVSDYDAIVEISRASHLFITKGAFQAFDAMFPDHMNGLDGAKHTAARSSVAPAFSMSLLPLYYPLVQDLTSRLYAELLRATSRGEKVTLKPYIRSHYMRGIVEISTGMVMDGAIAERIQTLYDAVEEGLVTFMFGPLGKRAFKAQEELLGVIRDVVVNGISKYADVIDKVRECGDNFAKEGMRELKKGNLSLLPVLIATSSLSTAQDAVHDPEIVDSLAKTLLFIWAAGISTNSVTTLSAIFEFGLNSDVRDSLIREQDEAVSCNQDSQEVTYDQVMKGMPLLDSFLNETMRMYPTDAQMYRVAGEDVEILGKFVAKGTMVCMNNFSAHRDERIYKDANQFVMDRFLNRRHEEKAPPVLSFGAPGSAHYCIGYALAKLQIKCALATLLRSYSMKLDESQSREFQYQPIIEPKSGVMVEQFALR